MFLVTFSDVLKAKQYSFIKKSIHSIAHCIVSPHQELLSSNPCKHPIIYLKDVQHEHLASVVEFMYSGAVYVGNQHLDDVLSVSQMTSLGYLLGVDVAGGWGGIFYW